jgi:3-deoxy-7-phosphoheptulonate synthase
MRHTVALGRETIGGTGFLVVAGPCSIESREQLLQIARQVHAAGASALRGGVFKMRADPGSFQGLGREALPLVDDAKRETGLPFVAEVTSPGQIAALVEHVDMLQVGSRNMHNSSLLKELGLGRKPVLLKRGLAAELKEWLLAADYIIQGGNENIVLCERGIRTFGDETRNTLDLAGAVWARQHSSLPVIVDPSHGTGRPELIGPMCMAAAAAGLDGIMIEVHHEPDRALSDGFQSLTPEQFARIVTALRPLVRGLGRELGSPGGIDGLPAATPVPFELAGHSAKTGEQV